MRADNVDECRKALAAASPSRLPGLISRYARDERAGVQSAVEAARKRLARIRAEERRLTRLAAMEEMLREQGYEFVAGVDEVGRGALAGPLTACAVVLSPGVRIEGLDDSKRLKPVQREAIALEIRASAITWHVEHVPAADVDALGMTEALRRAMNGALAGLDPAPDHVLVDGLPMHLGCTETAVVKGDSTVAAISAASVLAKVARDALMCEFDSEYPGYGFAINKGYGTTEHVEAIEQLGVCRLHRRSFAPCGGTMRLF